MKNTYLLTVFNATFNNISVIPRWSVLLVEETGRPGEKPQVSDKLYSHKFVSIRLCYEWESNYQLSVVVDSDYIGVN
jgi:hypothetical protein